MDKIAVSILGKENKDKLVNKLISNGFTTIHYDIMDGKFVKNVSMPADEINHIFKNTKPHTINLHFMVKTPLQYIEAYKNRAHFMTFHYEAMPKKTIIKVLKKYQNKTRLGIAINPNTQVETIIEFLPLVSHVLVMSVVPGKGGQKFMPIAIEKIKKLKKIITKRKLNCFIQVDGGVNDKTGPLCFKAGANMVVSGSFLLNNLENKAIINKIIE